MSSPAPPETTKMPSSEPLPIAWGSAPSVNAGSPWGKVTVPVPCSFEDLMSEELAKEIADEQQQDKSTVEDLDVDLSKFMIEEGNTSNDMLLAQMLQHEFDREHDRNLQKEEDHWNQSSKVKISFKNYRSTHPSLQDDIEDHEEVEEEEDIDEEVPNFKKGGIARVGNTVISKHDANLCARKNAKRVMEQFPPECDVGDCQGIKMRLPNRVYNDLKMHSVSETKRSNRVHEKKEHYTAEQAVDEKTRLIMYKLVNNGVLDTVNGQISTGKEAVVFHADGGRMPNQIMPKECALKVFKTTLNEFKNRVKYVRGDRYFKENFKKQNPRTFIKIWAEKEMMNLKKLENIGVPCPRPIQLRKHVLVMEFIGDERKPAPKLKDAKLGAVDMQIAYEQCIRNMKKMYREGHLVHADLSAYNMLWHNGVLYFIDVAQAVEFMHPHAMEFLLRDCTNVCQFFSAAGVPKVPTCFDLFNEVTGLNLQGSGEIFLQQLEEYEKNEDKLRSGGETKDYPFEFFFDKAQKEREEQKRLTDEKVVSDEEDTDSEEDEPAYEFVEAEEKLVLRPLKTVEKQASPKEPSDTSQEDTAEPL